MLTASVVICTATRERAALLRACVDSVLAGDRAPDELFVVVDSDETLSADLARALPHPVRVLVSGSAGLSAARNRGIDASGCDVVAFLDDDAQADPAWLASLLATFASHPDLIGAGGPVLPLWGAPRRWLPDDLLWIVGCTYVGHRRDAGPIRNPIGANMAFSRRELVASGGFAVDFGKRGNALRTCEETEMALRLRSRYGPDRIRYVPGAAARHYVPPSRISWRLLVRRSLSEGVAKGRLRQMYASGAVGDERRYALALVTRRAPRLLLDGARRGDLDACRGALGIVLSLLVTSAAFVVGNAAEHQRQERARARNAHMDEGTG